jgi:predicted Zn-dependent protease
MTGALAAQLNYIRELPKPLLAVMELISQEKMVKAEQLCKAFMQKVPRNVEGMRLLAEIANRLGVGSDAEFLLESALTLSPDNSKVHIDYVQILRKNHKYQAALEQAKLLCKKAPSNPQFQSIYAIEAMQSGDFDTALELFESVLKVLPEDPITLTSRGHALKTCGKTDAAIDSYRRAITRSPSHGEAYYSLANLKTFRFSETEISAMERLEADTETSHMSRVYLNFALGKAYEDEQNFAKSFAYYQVGNDLKQILARYKAEEITAEFDTQREVFTPSLIARHVATGCTAPDPIFILGLPRAGSTLLEQILSSHSRVDGTMELPNILSLAQKLRRGERMGNGSDYPRVLDSLTAEDYRQFGEQFIQDTRVHRGSADFFIDKMPNNFRHIGLIHLMLPNAKIIDARRHPMGCCFSGFKQLFAEGQEFSYGLQEIGTYYSDYVRLMNHWDTVLPGKILRVNYEDVVADLDTQVHRILDHCGLEFEQSCISFYDNKRSVRTPSSEQVRQPIYQGGLEQWQNYETYLEPLKNSLGSVLEDYLE